MKFLSKVDPQTDKLIKLEEKRQQETLMMIPSENVASYAVEEAVGSSLGNKYAEGYPGRRYYQGQSVVDQLENVVMERAKKLFGVAAANVQPHSGSPANFAVMTALLNPGDTIMGLSLSSGGHLTHGAAGNATSKYFKSVPYEVDKNGWLDYEVILSLAKKHKPRLIIAGTTAYPRKIDWKKFGEIADSIGAWLLADISHLSGLIVGGAYPSPAPYVHVVTTTTHKTLRGPRGAIILSTNKGLSKDPELSKKIDMAIIPGIQGGPHMNAIAGIGVALHEASKPQFKKYAQQIVANAKVLADELKSYDFELLTGGTDSHLILTDIRNKNLLGNTAAEALEAVGIVLNRNSIPHDPNPPFYPSGLRLGTPGLTSRGMKEPQMQKIAKFMDETITAVSQTKVKLNMNEENEKKRVNRKKIIEGTKELAGIKKEVLALCKKFPLKKIY